MLVNLCELLGEIGYGLDAIARRESGNMDLSGSITGEQGGDSFTIDVPLAGIWIFSRERGTDGNLFYSLMFTSRSDEDTTGTVYANGNYQEGFRMLFSRLQDLCTNEQTDSWECSSNAYTLDLNATPSSNGLRLRLGGSD